MGLGRSAFPPTGPQGQGPCSLKCQVASVPQLPSPVKGGPMKQSTQGTFIHSTNLRAEGLLCDRNCLSGFGLVGGLQNADKWGGGGGLILY